ncbi:hypothetical protein ABZX33_32095 [Streptomyces sp. NPDC004608]|uniref:hypothetical protein n=1 Tax=unclassified Streptomyces TaxID=2593676 RepID=UPI0033A9E511
MSGENVPTNPPTPQLRVGELVLDTARNRLAILMDTGGTWADGRYALRPPGGGVEWPAWRSDIRPATVTDRLRPALAELNERSSGGAPWG